jgi:hypothetical protein
VAYINTTTGEIIDAKPFKKRQTRIAGSARGRKHKSNVMSNALTKLVPLVLVGTVLVTLLIHASR